jgi:hypothetical protein
MSCVPAFPSSLSVCSWECEECYSINSTGKDSCELCCYDRCLTNSVSSCASTVDTDVESACCSSSSPPRLAFEPVLPTSSPTSGRSTLHDALKRAASSSPLYLAPLSPTSATRATARAPAGVVGHVCENCEAKFFPDPLKAEQFQHFCGQDCLWSARFRQQDEDRARLYCARFGGFDHGESATSYH